MILHVAATATKQLNIQPTNHHRHYHHLLQKKKPTTIKHKNSMLNLTFHFFLLVLFLSCTKMNEWLNEWFCVFTNEYVAILCLWTKTTRIYNNISNYIENLCKCNIFLLFCITFMTKTEYMFVYRTKWFFFRIKDKEKVNVEYLLTEKQTLFRILFGRN